MMWVRKQTLQKKKKKIINKKIQFAGSVLRSETQDGHKNHKMVNKTTKPVT